MRLLLAPGASGGVESLAGAVGGLRRRGVEAEAIAIPQGRVEKAAQRFLELARPDDVVAGQSYGGRAASRAVRILRPPLSRRPRCHAPRPPESPPSPRRR